MSGPLQSSPAQIHSPSNPRLDPIESKSSYCLYTLNYKYLRLKSWHLKLNTPFYVVLFRVSVVRGCRSEWSRCSPSSGWKHHSVFRGLLTILGWPMVIMHTTRGTWTLSSSSSLSSGHARWQWCGLRVLTWVHCFEDLRLGTSFVIGLHTFLGDKSHSSSNNVIGCWEF